jgi:hypothetical protein
MIIVKERGSAGNSWPVWHASVCSGNEFIYLNSTSAKGTSANFWNGTTPTSSVFSVGNDSATNGTTTHIAYCFAEVAGFSKFGSYTGNGSADGPFVYCGFRPRFIMFKMSSSTSHWVIVDTSCSTYNQTTVGLEPDSSGAETTGIGIYDFLSNGFKCRNSVANEANVNGGTYIFMALAENPFKNSLAR